MSESYVTSTFKSWRISVLSYIMLVLVYIPINSGLGYLFPTSSPTFINKMAIQRWNIISLWFCFVFFHFSMMASEPGHFVSGRSSFGIHLFRFCAIQTQCLYFVSSEIRQLPLDFSICYHIAVCNDS